MKKALLIITLFLSASLWYLSFNSLNNNETGQKFDPRMAMGPEWTQKHRLIAHAMGEIGGKTYTNSLEAFNQNYKKGFRVFEVDLILTADNYLVARHDWTADLYKMLEQQDPTGKSGKPLTLEEFKSMKINQYYTPVDFVQIVKLMQKYEDLYIVTDTKEISNNVISNLVDTVKKINPRILDRVVIQIYNERDLQTVKSIYDFKSIIYTLYMTNASDKSVVDFARKNGIGVITMADSRFSWRFVDKLTSLGIVSYVHTINSLEKAQELQRRGVYGFYTDSLLPADLD